MAIAEEQGGRVDNVDGLIEELKGHPHGEGLGKLVHALAFSAFDEKRTDLEEGLRDAAERVGVDEANAETSYGNVLRALKKGGSATAVERTLLGALLAKGVGIARAAQKGAVEKNDEATVSALAWLAANTVVDGLSRLDAALRSAEIAAGPLWRAGGRLVEALESTGPTRTFGRASALVFLTALSVSDDADAADVRVALSTAIRDPLLFGVLKGGGSERPIVMAGEVTAAPRSGIATFFLTITLILPILALLKLLGRYALHVRRPAELRVNESGVTVQARYELLGKPLREFEVHIPRVALSRAARQIRYPKLGTYVGIATLLVGSYIGLRLVIDGARSGAPEFLGIGTAILVGALVLDYMLARLPSLAKNRCEIYFQPRKGGSIALGAIDPVLADKALALLRSTAPQAKK
ncbi:MAG: hypothetical protein U0414_39560 [Polyangiaceae bacterium]